MQIGVSFPTAEIGNDPAVIRDFAQAVEDLGYDYITVIDHVLQGPPADDGNWQGYYGLQNPFHEPLVTLGFLAAATRRVGLATAILILPQRPTVLVAKQTAEIDVLTGGRLRLGVGIGWNKLEYEALGQDFHNRGRRVEEQVAVMRKLWTEDLVTFEGEWHRIDNAGINPRSVQQPIPIWFGAFAPPAIKRAGRLADGWFANPYHAPGPEAQHDFDLVRQSVAEAGRDPAAFGIDATLNIRKSGSQEWAAEAAAWREMGASHVTVRTMRARLPDIDAHIEALRQFKAAYRG